MTGKKHLIKNNNAGFTLVEMMVTFALLGIFMVAAARVISYSIGIYYAAKGNSYGYEVSYMLANKIKGQLENAGTANRFTIDGSSIDADGAEVFKEPVVIGGNQVKFVDSTGSIVTICTEADDADDGFLVIKYAETGIPGTDTYYKAVDWKFDDEAYMGYRITDLQFEYPGSDYPKNVIRMNMTLHSSKYGDFNTVYYIRCCNIDEVTYK